MSNREVWVLEIEDTDGSFTIRDMTERSDRAPDLENHAKAYKRVHDINGRVVRYVPEGKDKERRFGASMLYDAVRWTFGGNSKDLTPFLKMLASDDFDLMKLSGALEFAGFNVYPAPEDDQ